MSMRRVIEAAALLVCSVENTRWPVSDDCMAICAVSRVAYLADHDDVGVLAQDGAQVLRKIQADRRLHLHLIDAGELIFDRVLDGEHLHFRTASSFSAV